MDQLKVAKDWLDLHLTRMVCVPHFTQHKQAPPYVLRILGPLSFLLASSTPDSETTPSFL